MLSFSGVNDGATGGVIPDTANSVKLDVLLAMPSICLFL